MRKTVPTKQRIEYAVQALPFIIGWKCLGQSQWVIYREEAIDGLQEIGFTREEAEPAIDEHIRLGRLDQDSPAAGSGPLLHRTVLWGPWVESNGLSNGPTSDGRFRWGTHVTRRFGAKEQLYVGAVWNHGQRRARKADVVLAVWGLDGVESGTHTTLRSRVNAAFSSEADPANRIPFNIEPDGEWLVMNPVGHA